MMCRLISGDFIVERKVASIDDMYDFIKQFCKEYHVTKCTFKLTGEAEIKVVIEESIGALFG